MIYTTGDVLFDRKLCFDLSAVSPAEIDPRHLPFRERVAALHKRDQHPRMVPVPEVDCWDSWLVIAVRDKLALIAPCLWQDLDHFEHLNAAREAGPLDRWPVSFRQRAYELDWHGVVLLGCAQHIALEDLAYWQVTPAWQRKVHSGQMAGLRAAYRAMLGESEAVFAATMLYDGHWYWWVGRGVGWNRDRARAKLVPFHDARDAARQQSGFVEVA